MSYWSVVQTESRRESVAANFLQRDFQIYFPRIAERERVTPLFPGYLFVEIVDQWWSVRWTVGVVKILMINDQPAKVPVEIMNRIRKSEIDGLVQLPKKAKLRTRSLRCGDAVMVVRGSFEGRLGVYQGQSGQQRSRILLNLLGRQVRAIVPTLDMVRAV